MLCLRDLPGGYQHIRQGQWLRTKFGHHSEQVPGVGTEQWQRGNWAMASFLCIRLCS